MDSESRWKTFYRCILFLLVRPFNLNVCCVKDFNTFSGEVWPGPCVFPDYTQAKVRLWWANLVKDFVSNGVDGIWNDMNEPAVFKVVRYSLLVLAVFKVVR